jgi:hypothetical protein
VLPVLADLQVAIAEPRDRVAEILGAIVRRRKRTESARSRAASWSLGKKPTIEQAREAADT